MIVDPSILSQIESDCLGVLWLTSKDINENPPGWASVNYLLDGLLAKPYPYSPPLSLDSNTISYEHNTSQESCLPRLFSVPSFGRAFYIGHVKVSSNSNIFMTTLSQIRSMIEIMMAYMLKGTISGVNKILVLEEVGVMEKNNTKVNNNVCAENRGEDGWNPKVDADNIKNDKEIVKSDSSQEYINILKEKYKDIVFQRTQISRI